MDGAPLVRNGISGSVWSLYDCRGVGVYVSDSIDDMFRVSIVFKDKEELRMSDGVECRGEVNIQCEEVHPADVSVLYYV